MGHVGLAEGDRDIREDNNGNDMNRERVAWVIEGSDEDEDEGENDGEEGTLGYGVMVREGKKRWLDPRVASYCQPGQTIGKSQREKEVA